MPTVQRLDPDQKFRGAAAYDAELEWSATLGPCNVTVTQDADPGAPDTVDILFAGTPPADATIDAAFAAFPSISPGATGSFVVAPGVAYLLAEIPIAVGDHFVVRARVHAVLGTVADAAPEYEDLYSCVWRETTGNVQHTSPRSEGSGNIPGFKITVSDTATSVIVAMRVRTSGTITIFTNEVTTPSTGSLS